MLTVDCILNAAAGGFNSPANNGDAVLPATTAGSMVVLVVVEANGSGIAVPAGFFQTITPIVASGSRLLVFHRPDIPAGETTWNLATLSTLAEHVDWIALETTRLDMIEPVDVWQTSAALAGAGSVSTGTTASTSDPDSMCVAVHNARDSAVPPTVGLPSNGFTPYISRASTPPTLYMETDLSLLFPGATGTYESSANFTGNTGGLGVILVFRAVGDLPAPVGGRVTT